MAGYSKQDAVAEAKRRGLVPDHYEAPAEDIPNARDLPGILAKRAWSEAKADPLGTALDIGSLPARGAWGIANSAAHGDLWPALGVINPMMAIVGQMNSDPKVLDRITINHHPKPKAIANPPPPGSRFDVPPQKGLGSANYGDTEKLPRLHPEEYKGGGLDPVVMGLIGSLIGGRAGREFGGAHPIMGEVMGSGFGAAGASGGAALESDPKHALSDAELALIAGLGRAGAYRGIKALAPEAYDPVRGAAYRSSVRVHGGRDPDPHMFPAGAPFFPDVAGQAKAPGRFDPKMRASPQQKYINEVVEDAKARGAPVPHDVPITASPALERVNPPRPKPIIGRASRAVRRMFANGFGTEKNAKALAQELDIPIPPKTSAMKAVRDALESEPHSPAATKFRGLYPNTLGLALAAGGALGASGMTDQERQDADFHALMASLKGTL